MNSITNMFRSLENSVENKSKKNNKYEGFNNYNNENQLAEQSKKILSETNNENDYSLQNKYNSLLLEYQKKLAELSDESSEFINRVSSNNSYLNKFIRWTDPLANEIKMYVTNQGIAKPIVDMTVYNSILEKNGCPDNKNVIDITIPWKSTYTVEGTIIPTSPSLIVGTPMKTNESCGNEGLNVYVDKLINTSSSVNSNALYELTEVGIPANLGKIGYVDSNSLLYVYPDSNIEQDPNGGQPKLKNLPIGVSNKIVNINSVWFENYPKSNRMNKYYGLASNNNVKKQELNQLRIRLDQISQQLLKNTEKLNIDETNITKQSILQNQSIGNYLNEYKNNNNKINNFGSNIDMDGIVNDSDINVLKENYNYYFWSILAVGAVLVSMNIVKN